MSAGRVPPHDLDAEAAVISAILLSREALDRVLEILKPEHFYSDANGRVYEAAQQLALEGKPIDIISVASWLRDRERLAQVGGASYLAQLRRCDARCRPRRHARRGGIRKVAPPTADCDLPARRSGGLRRCWDCPGVHRRRGAEHLRACANRANDNRSADLPGA